MKEIKEITEQDCREILKYVFKDCNYSYHGFKDIDDEYFKYILYNNGQDMCLLYDDDTRVINWLYENDFDITYQLKSIKDLSAIQMEVDDLIGDLLTLSLGTKNMKSEYHKNFTMEYILNKCYDIFDKYFKIYEKYE